MTGPHEFWSQPFPEHVSSQASGDGPVPAADPTIRWGDTKTLVFPAGATDAGQTSEILRVNLDTDPGSRLIGARLCRLNLHAEVVAGTGLLATSVVGTTLVELFIGNGSTNLAVRRRYNALPQVPLPGSTPGSVGIPLDLEWYYPLTHIYGRVSVTALDCSVAVSLWLTPVQWDARDALT